MTGFKKISAFTILYLLTVSIFSCDLVEDLVPKTESDKRIKLLTKGGAWRVDSLTLKSDVLSGGISTITSEEIRLNNGTLEFLDPENSNNPDYNAGYIIHRYVENGVAITDTLAWVPYNFNSRSDNHITIFYNTSNQIDYVAGAYDMYFDILAFENKKVRIESWRRETISGGSGGSYGTFRRYHLTR